MGTFKINLHKISRLCGKTTVAATAAIFVVLLWKVDDVATKSLSFSSSLNYIDEDVDVPEGETTTFTHTSACTTTTPVPPGGPIKCKLDANKLHEVIWVVNNTELHEFSLSNGDKQQGFRLAVHLADCSYRPGESIDVAVPKGKTVSWNCPTGYTINSIPPNDFDGQHTYPGVHSSSQSAKQVMIDLTEVSMKAKMTFETEKGTLENASKATIIVNVYKDMDGNGKCDTDFFDCNQATCQTTCCSENYHSSRGSSDQNEAISSYNSDSIFKDGIWRKSTGSGARCIPKDLKCNGRPNCGELSNSADERDAVCSCECRPICLTWNYVLTSLAIAILFIITPTAIVFALFHRRNLALERQRLLRLAQMRVSDMQGEFTRDGPSNDHPPTYDEVYDIKEPPPCFCKAIAMQKEYDLRQEQQQGSSVDTVSSQLPDVEEASQENTDIGFQNLGFQCSCASITGGNEGGSKQDILPSYNELTRRRSRENEVDQCVDRDEVANANDSQDASQENWRFENINLDKEEDI